MLMVLLRTRSGQTESTLFLWFQRYGERENFPVAGLERTAVVVVVVDLNTNFPLRLMAGLNRSSEVEIDFAKRLQKEVRIEWEFFSCQRKFSSSQSLLARHR